ncbi:MAG: PH domain-containing protein [Lysobacterales bacterium]
MSQSHEFFAAREDVQLKPLAPEARWGFQLGWAIAAMVPLLPIGLISRANDVEGLRLLGLLAAVFLILQIAAFLFARASYRRTRYALDAEGLLIQRGVIWQSETRVPRSRVQHTDLNRGPIDRWLGLAELRVHTAGTRLAAVSLGGLREDEARRLRNDLLGEDDDAV